LEINIVADIPPGICAAPYFDVIDFHFRYNVVDWKCGMQGDIQSE
jgi:hypothetical protein